MTKKKWHAKIKKQLVDLNTFKASYNSVIDALAGILEQRDEVKKEFEKNGSHILISKTSDRGAENSAVNPLVSLMDKLNNTALAYWRELGLTPASFKKMNAAVPETQKSGLAEALASIEKSI